MPLLDIQKISKAYYSNPVLDDVSFSVSAGEIYGILGVNGSGKSTLVRLISGNICPDAGEMLLNGKSVRFDSPFDAISCGISAVHQGTGLIANMTVAENVFIFGFRRETGELRRYSLANMSGHCRTLLDSLHIGLDSRAPAGTLNLVSAQLVKIAAAVDRFPSLVVVDEPFLMLTPDECGLICDLFRLLKEKGISVLFTTGNISQAVGVSDRLAILKEGHLYQQEAFKSRGVDYFIREISDTAKYRYPRISGMGPRKALVLKNITTHDRQIRNVSFELADGEILGVAGLPGSGKSTLACALFGEERIRSGELSVDGKARRFREPADAIACGIGMMTGDSEREGIISDFSIADNVTLAALPEICRHGVISAQKENDVAYRVVKKYGIVPEQIDAPAFRMTEGQRQKLVFCKWLMKGCGTLIMDNATKGMDISSKVELYNFMNTFAMEGGSILFISTDFNELIGMCDRVLVLNSGEITGVLKREELSMVRIVDMLNK